MNTEPTRIGIGIDCGTSGIRAVALTESHHLLAESALPLTEQTPEHWWTITLAVLDQLFTQLHVLTDLSHSQLAISLDATSSTVLLIDGHGQALTPAKMYYDACPDTGAEIHNRLNENSGAHGAQSTLAKALTLKNSLCENNIATQDWMVCHQADWLLFQLTGKLGISDENNCLKLGYDPVTQQWEKLTRELIGENHLPKVVAPATPIAELTSALCQRWKLNDIIQVASGTTDSIAAFLATGAMESGDAVISLGSTLAFKLLTQNPYFDASKGIYSHRLWQQWLVGGASNAGGASLLEAFPLTKLSELSQQPLIQPAPVACYYPLPQYCTGERFPINDPKLSAPPLPISLTDREVFSSMVHGLVDLEQQAWQQLSQGSGQPIKRLFACGGGNKNPAWAGLRKSSLPYPHSRPISEQAAVGAAMLALKAMSNNH